MAKNLSSLWVEKFRPQSVKDMILPNDFKKFFAKIIKSGEVPNLLLSSPTPGTGKTSIAKAIVHDLEADYIYINASSENSIDVIRNQIAGFAQTMSFSASKKIVILDEADGLTPQFQKALRAYMEEFESNCRFILTCNYISKIIPALQQGRTMCFDFNMAKYKNELLPLVVARVEGILKFEKIEYEEGIVQQLVDETFPSIREAIATIQQYADTHGKVDADIIKTIQGDTRLADFLLQDKPNVTNARAYIEQAGMSYTDVFKNLFDNFVPRCGKKGQATILLAEYEYRCAFSADPSLQIAACLIELLSCVKKG